MRNSTSRITRSRNCPLCSPPGPAIDPSSTARLRASFFSLRRLSERTFRHREPTSDYRLAPRSRSGQQECCQSLSLRRCRDSAPVRQVLEKVVQKWRGRVGQHDRFVQETEEMLELILKRIEDETEKLYPLVRKQREGESLRRISSGVPQDRASPLTLEYYALHQIAEAVLRNHFFIRSQHRRHNSAL